MKNKFLLLSCTLLFITLIHQISLRNVYCQDEEISPEDIFLNSLDSLKDIPLPEDLLPFELFSYKFDKPKQFITPKYSMKIITPDKNKDFKIRVIEPYDTKKYTMIIIDPTKKIHRELKQSIYKKFLKLKLKPKRYFPN